MIRHDAMPGSAVSLERLPSQPDERHEVIVDLFGRHIFWLRSLSTETTRKLAECPRWTAQARSDVPQAVW